MKNRRTDPEFDDDLDTVDDADPDDSDDLDTPDSDDSDTVDDADPDDDDEPDDEGYTKAERKELEEIEAEYRDRKKSADDKISQDGRRIRELEEENERLKARKQGDDQDDQTSRRTRRNTDEPDDDDNTFDLEDVDFSDIDMTKLDPNARKAFERMYDATSRTVKHSKSVEQQLRASEAENRRLKADDDRYQQYATTYGLNREQYDQYREKMDSGDEIGAHKILTIHSSAHRRRQERSATLSDDSGYIPNGSPDSPPTSRRKSLRDTLQDKFDNAKSEKERDAVANEIWETFDANIAEEMTLPSPVS